jgi:hypothetical protein
VRQNISLKKLTELSTPTDNQHVHSLSLPQKSTKPQKRTVVVVASLLQPHFAAAERDYSHWAFTSSAPSALSPDQAQ